MTNPYPKVSFISASRHSTSCACAVARSEVVRRRRKGGDEDNNFPRNTKEQKDVKRDMSWVRVGGEGDFALNNVCRFLERGSSRPL